MKKILAAMTAALLLASLGAGSTLAAKPTTTDLMGSPWRIFNAMPATSSFWDINKVKLASSALTFPIAKFDTPTTGSFATYFSTNYNTDIAGRTFNVTANWTGGTYETRSGAGGYARFWFQDVTSGPYTSNDYWWYSGSVLDLNTVTLSGSVTAPLVASASWTNICGQSAIDAVAHPGPNCVGGTDPNVSPAAGFANAMKNVKQLGLSFGNDGGYAKGIALDGGTGTFSVSAFFLSQ
jgi:hypothetical protein